MKEGRERERETHEDIRIGDNAKVNEDATRASQL